ncbi:putative metalloprotease CJM1_0395 family protein [Methyloversatilis sp.]|uniref:putative metalloprotease CJM1_0395 family protein n=1 Tax=Methyloversatilis sp. TaxID=2569862 RepID=UPI003D27AD17
MNITAPSFPTATMSAAPRTRSAGEFSPEETEQLRALQARDREVRQHEQAHQAAAGGLATSGANYSFQRGPDGVNYAVGGEVSLDVSPGRTPEETLRRARQISAAALAPAEPSGQDLAVAARAAQMARQAEVELAASTDGSVVRPEVAARTPLLIYAESRPAQRPLIDVHA